MDCSFLTTTITTTAVVRRRLTIPRRLSQRKRRRRVVVSRAGCEPSSSSSNSSSSLNTPLEPKTEAGRFLSGVFQNQRQLFHVAVAEELRLLAEDRDRALTRIDLSSRSDEASLHRRIAQLKEQECQIAVEDVMYMLILSKFSEIGVLLVPKLSRCIYNGRLEISSSKDWELESIHNFEVLQMIKEHVSMVIGLRINSSVRENWATTEVRKFRLGRVYAASTLYGYFLKSATLRYKLERCLSMAYKDLHVGHRNTLQFSESALNLVIESASPGQVSSRQEWKHESLRSYILGFDAEALKICTKLKSKEADNLIKKHSCALFGDAKTDLLEKDDLILTSFSTMKRLVLEAVAFGSFLWDIEDYVDSMFKLQET